MPWEEKGKIIFKTLIRVCLYVFNVWVWRSENNLRGVGSPSLMDLGDRP